MRKLINISFIPEAQKATNGVFSYLASKRFLNAFVTTFGSEAYSTATVSDNILNLNAKEFYAAKENSLDLEVGLTFTSHQFSPTAYTLTQYKGDGYILKSYVLQASISLFGDDWETIHTKFLGDDACRPGLLDTVNISSEFWKPYKRFRISNKGKNCRGDRKDFEYVFRVGGIELFGQLTGSMLNQCSCVIKGHNLELSVFFILLSVS